MKLHTPQKRESFNRWYCGSFAFSAITGKSFEETRSRINWVRGVRETQGITGLREDVLIEALSKAGYSSQCIYASHKGCEDNKNLNQWLKTLDKNDNNIYLVIVTGHYVVTQGRQLLIDNHTEYPVQAFMAPWQKKRVKKVWIISY